MDDYDVEARQGGPDTASRFRSAVLLLLGAAAIAVTAREGLRLWPQLPEQIPTHFGLSGAPDAWSGKSTWSVFGILILAAVLQLFMAVAASTRLSPKGYNYPGKERVLRLPIDQQHCVIQPIREGLAWMGAAMSVALAMLARQSWEVALEQRGGIDPWGIPVAVLIGMVAVVLGITRTRALVQEIEENAGE